MTTTRVYKSTDAGAPVLSGAASKMIDLLDAVLVNGYNSKTITITRTGDTATATCTAHGFVTGRRVLISGATPSDYNGEFTVLTAATDTFTFEVLGSPTTPPTGTITCIVAPAGWTKPFTGTNKAAFRNSVAAGGTGLYLRVLDDGSGTGGAREALCRAYLTMSDVDTGTIETPTVAQQASSIVFRKSNTVDATSRAWILVADELTFYLTIDEGYTYVLVGAGDIDSYVPADAYRYFISGRIQQVAASSYSFRAAGLVDRSNTWATPSANGLYFGRGYAGTGSPIPAAIPILANNAIGSGSAIGGGYGQIASPVPGTALGMFLPAWVASENTLRGRFPGLYMPVHSMDGVAAGTEYADTPGRPSGSVLTVLRSKISGTTGDDGHLCVESALPWR